MRDCWTANAWKYISAEIDFVGKLSKLIDDNDFFGKLSKLINDNDFFGKLSKLINDNDGGINALWELY